MQCSRLAATHLLPASGCLLCNPLLKSSEWVEISGFYYFYYYVLVLLLVVIFSTSWGRLLFSGQREDPKEMLIILRSFLTHKMKYRFQSLSPPQSLILSAWIDSKFKWGFCFVAMQKYAFFPETSYDYTASFLNNELSSLLHCTKYAGIEKL